MADPKDFRSQIEKDDKADRERIRVEKQDLENAGKEHRKHMDRARSVAFDICDKIALPKIQTVADALFQPGWHPHLEDCEDYGRRCVCLGQGTKGVLQIGVDATVRELGDKLAIRVHCALCEGDCWEDDKPKQELHDRSRLFSLEECKESSPGSWIEAELRECGTCVRSQ